MTRQRFIAIIVGVILGVLAWVMVSSRMAEQERQLKASRRQPTVQTTDVVVAKADIPENTVLKPDMIATQPVPTEFVQPYAIIEPMQALGQQTSAPVAKGEQLLATKLMAPGAAGTLATKTPVGKRAVTLGMDPLTAVGGFIRPGDHVDILWTVLIPVAQGQQPQPVTVTLFQDVQVLAVGGEMVDAEGRRGRSGGQEERGMSLTFALTPQETGLVLFAREQGKIQLSLRPRTDTSTVQLPPASLDALFQAIMPQQANAGAQPQQQEAPKGPRHVEVFRGLTKETVEVPAAQ